MLYLLYPDCTVGIGFAPIQPLVISSSWTFTTGRELHPAPEDEPLLFFSTSLYMNEQ